MVRGGAEYFTALASPAQRRYEALRAYFLDEMPAAEVAGRFGYSAATIHQLATLLRKGRLTFFAETRPGPRGPRKATGILRAKALELRAAGHSVTEIAAALTDQGMPISAQTIWQILEAEGLPRLSRRDEGRRDPAAPASPAVDSPAGVTPLASWPAERLSMRCEHAGLLLLLPAMSQISLADLISRAGYPAAGVLTSWHLIGAMLLVKCARQPRVSQAGPLADQGLAFALGLTAWPSAASLGRYSRQVRRECNSRLLSGLIGALRPAGLATGEAGFNCDVRVVSQHGAQNGPRGPQPSSARAGRSRPSLTFLTQDHASADLVYSHAGITRAEQAAEIMAFVNYWETAAGADPGLLVMDSQLVTNTVLDQLTSRAVRWLAARPGGRAEIARLTALPDSEWMAVTVFRAGRHRQGRLHEDTVKLTGIGARVRQIAVTNLGCDEPALLITNDTTMDGGKLVARYAERAAGTDPEAGAGGFALGAIFEDVPVNADLDATLTVVAGSLHRLLAQRLPRYERASPPVIWRDFLDTAGTLHVDADGVTCALDPRPVRRALLDADISELRTLVPWWGDRSLRFSIARP